MSELELKPRDQVEIVLRCTVDEVTHDARGGYFVRLEIHRPEDSNVPGYNYLDVDMNSLDGTIHKLEFDPFLGEMK